MTDIVERLRHCSENCGDEYMHELAGRAAAEIERLRALYDEAMTCWKQTTEQCQIAVDQATTLRAEVVEKVADAIAKAWDEHGRVIDAATAAIDLIRADVLEEAARVIENNCHDDMTRAEEAAAIRALKETPCSSS